VPTVGGPERLDDPAVPVLRAMRWWDVEPLVPLERELFGPGAWSAEVFWSELAAPDRWYVVADGPDGPLGYAGLAGGHRAEAEVQTIAVARHGQGRGLGRALLRALGAEAERRGATEVLLEVRADNAPAQALYRSEGFERIGLRRGYYQPEGVDAVVMRRR
jgi:ribosomal-protein-alanine N-acetyltransferase